MMNYEFVVVNISSIDEFIVHRLSFIVFKAF